MRPATLAALLAATVTLSACAARRPPAGVTTAPDLGRASALLREGCYRCLEEALALVQPLARTTAAARATAFDAAVLLAARDRELGMLGADHLPLARALGPDPVTPRARLFMDVIDAMPWPAAAQGPEERDRSLLAWRTLAPVVPGWHQALSALGRDDLAARYLRVGLECTWPGLVPGAVQADGTATPPPPGVFDEADPRDPPLLRFRRLVCTHPAPDELDATRAQSPRYAELDLVAGDAAMNGGALLTAERHYQEAFHAFPLMLPAAHGLARLHVMLEEYETSLPEYDVLLAAVPDQQDALLGKARALSQLGRHVEAVPLLDRLIAMGTWLVGDAHYWRGWNRLQLGDTDGAEADADLALRLMVNARVHVLAGAVAAKRNDWDRAGREFEAALPLDETDCDIPVSLGAVRGQQRNWAAAFTSYARASECLASSQAQLARRVGEIAAAPMDAGRRERFLRRARAAVDAAHRLEGQSRYNAAVSLANQGRHAEARPWAEQAAGWPEWQERARALTGTGTP